MEKGLTPLQKRTLERKAQRAALLAELHRPIVPIQNPAWAEEVTREIVKAEQRLKREKVAKGEYTPPRPADHVTAFLVSPEPRVKEHGNAKCRKQRNHVAAHTKATKKSWGKAGHQFSNKLLRSRAEAQKFLDDKAYAS